MSKINQVALRGLDDVRRALQWVRDDGLSYNAVARAAGAAHLVGFVTGSRPRRDLQVMPVIRYLTAADREMVICRADDTGLVVIDSMADIRATLLQIKADGNPLTSLARKAKIGNQLANYAHGTCEQKDLQIAPLIKTVIAADYRALVRRRVKPTKRAQRLNGYAAQRLNNLQGSTES